VEMFEALRTLVADDRIELAPVPELLEDLRRVRKRVTQTGVTIELPRLGRRHCDYAMALALACDHSPRHLDGSRPPSTYPTQFGLGAIDAGSSRGRSPFAKSWEENDTAKPDAEPVW